MSIQINSQNDLRLLLREERLRQGLGQAEIPGVGRTTVLAFENGKGDIRMETLFSIIKGLGVGLTLDLGHNEPELAPGASPSDDDDIDLGGFEQ